MRPDEANMIFLARYIKWQGLPVDVAVPVGNGILDRAIVWLKAFALAERRLLIYREGEDWYALGPPAFQVAMYERVKDGVDIWSQGTTMATGR